MSTPPTARTLAGPRMNAGASNHVDTALAAAQACEDVARGLLSGSDHACDLAMLFYTRHHVDHLRDALAEVRSALNPRTVIGVSAEAGPAGLAIRVADSGIGIPAPERERMFEPFTQADSSLGRRHAGSGLGLHLARRLAAALGGTLMLEDAEGPGIVAALRFPPDRVMPISRPGAVPAAPAAG